MTNKKPDALNSFPAVVEVPIQWGDQDAFGHVNNTVAIRWFESARIAYLEQSGMSRLMQAKQIGPILAAINCNYRQQLHYPDTVWIGARVAKVGRSSLVIEHVVYSEKLDAVAADGQGTIVLFDYQTQRPQRMPEDVRAAVEKMEGRAIAAAES